MLWRSDSEVLEDKLLVGCCISLFWHVMSYTLNVQFVCNLQSAEPVSQRWAARAIWVLNGL